MATTPVAKKTINSVSSNENNEGANTLEFEVSKITQKYGFFRARKPKADIAWTGELLKKQPVIADSKDASEFFSFGLFQGKTTDISEQMVKTVIELSLDNPYLNAVQLSNMLKISKQIEVDHMTIRQIWSKQQMNTTELRVDKSARFILDIIK